MCDLSVGVSFLLGFEHEFARQRFETIFFNFALELYKFFQLIEEPCINFCELLYGLEGYPHFEGIIHME